MRSCAGCSSPLTEENAATQEMHSPRGERLGQKPIRACKGCAREAIAGQKCAVCKGPLTEETANFDLDNDSATAKPWGRCCAEDLRVIEMRHIDSGQRIVRIQGRYSHTRDKGERACKPLCWRGGFEGHRLALKARFEAIIDEYETIDRRVNERDGITPELIKEHKELRAKAARARDSLRPKKLAQLARADSKTEKAIAERDAILARFKAFAEDQAGDLAGLEPHIRVSSNSKTGRVEFEIAFIEGAE